MLANHSIGYGRHDSDGSRAADSRAHKQLKNKVWRVTRQASVLMKISQAYEQFVNRATKGT